MTSIMKMIEFNNVHDLFYSMRDCPVCHNSINEPPVLTLYIYVPNTLINVAIVSRQGNCRFYHNDVEVLDADYKVKTFAPKRIICHNCNDYYYSAIFVLDIFSRKLDCVYISSQTFLFEDNILCCRYNKNVAEISKLAGLDARKKVEVPFFENIVTDPYGVYNRMKKLVIFA